MQRVYQGLDAKWATNTLFDFLGGEDDYFDLPVAEAAASSVAKDFVQKAGGWLSRNWGSGKKAIRLPLANASPG